MISKVEARSRGKRVRAEMAAEAQAAADAWVVARCRLALDWGQYGRVMVFLPIERQGEVDTWPLVRWLWRQPGVEVYAPRVTRDGIEAVWIDTGTEFVETKWAIPEPKFGSLLLEARLDAVLIPLLGFDAQGVRVGYGQGYYDRFLAVHPEALRIGLGYDELLVPEGIAAEAHDVPLQLMVTESRLWRF